MSEEREERLAKNEVLFRSLNENIASLAGTLGGETPYEFVCECSTSGCFERILLTVQEYEAIRGDGTHFLIKDGHDQYRHLLDGARTEAAAALDALLTGGVR